MGFFPRQAEPLDIHAVLSKITQELSNLYVHKITGWPNVVKLLWDADTHAGVPLKVVLPGSAPMQG